DSFVRSPLLGWDKTQCIILISPQMGARFSQYFALMETGGSAGPALPGVERVLYVVEGEVTLSVGGDVDRLLPAGGFAFVPPDMEMQLRARAATRLHGFEEMDAPPSIPSP